MSDKAVFLDRDDTVIEDTGYIDDPGQVKLSEGAAESLGKLQGMGYKLIVVSNQSGVARGIVSEKVLGEIHGRLEALLREEGVILNKIYYCPFHPDGVIPKYRKESDLRKPNPGMFLKASEELGIDLESSWAIGDSERDVKAGKRAGCRTILINKPKEEVQIKEMEVKPDFTAVNIREAANIIKKYGKLGSEESEGIGGNMSEKDVSGKTEKEVQQEDKQMTSFLKDKKPEKNVEELLGEIIEQLRNIQRRDIFEDFSIMRLLAGVIQIAVLFCLFLGVWFLMSPKRDVNAIYLCLGFAFVLQVMSLTFYMMQNRK